jgi:glutathione peroxidase
MRGLWIAGAVLIGLASAGEAQERGQATGRKETPLAPDSFYRLTTKTLEGEAVDLKTYTGRVALVVNVASQCGYTPQYAGLEKLYEGLQSRGFVILGFPSNDFGGQEPGTPKEIRLFCSMNYDVTFPMFEKVVTRAGVGQSPVYANLQKQSGELPSWNFAKYLIGKDGKVIRFYKSDVKPDDAGLRKDIETALR